MRKFSKQCRVLFMGQNGKHGRMEIEERDVGKKFGPLATCHYIPLIGMEKIIVRGLHAT